MSKKKPNLKVEYIPIGKLKPFKGNPRKNEAAVGEIVRSIEHYGYTSPILVRRANNEVIAGHTRLLALKETGAEKAPVIYLDMSVKEARAYGIFDNKSTENTEWDVPKLTDLIEQLTADGIEWDDLGFTEEELAEMARNLDPCVPPVVEAGTVILGKIRERAYTEYSQFRSDLTAYLDRINERNAAMANASESNQTWQEAALWLKEDYWRGFLFDPDSELAGYLA